MPRTGNDDIPLAPSTEAARVKIEFRVVATDAILLATVLARLACKRVAEVALALLLLIRLRIVSALVGPGGVACPCGIERRVFTVATRCVRPFVHIWDATPDGEKLRVVHDFRNASLVAFR